MGESTFDYQHEESAGTYWRRRFIVLVIGLIAFGLAAWGLSSVVAVTPPASHPGGRSAGTRQQPGSGPAKTPKTVYRTQTPRTTSPGSTGRSRLATSGRSETAGRQQSATSPGQSQASVTGAQLLPTSGDPIGQANGHGTIWPAFCAEHAIVLSLFTGQTDFGPSQSPAFDINVVSTQQPECSFNVGSQHIALVIKEGPARIWSSADCAAGTTGLVAALKRGVPTVLTINWDRTTSAPGCSSRAAQVPAGVYTATAVDGDLSSMPVTFRLNQARN
jgi:hypothetical protein